jgi:predicted O-linked N-acetylglucosamine transferase (SPINDLY family)
MSRKATAQIKTLLAEALASHRAGNFSQAERCYTDILELEDANPRVLTLFGTLRAQQGNLREALRLLGRSLKIDPRQPFALNSLGNALHALKRDDEAIVQYERAIGLKPDHVTYTNRGNALMALTRYDEALRSFDKAIALDAGYAEAHSRRGDALRQLERFDDAVLSYDLALARRPRHPQDHFGRALALQGSARADLAIAAYDQAIAQKADFAEAYNNRGNAFASLGRYQDAVDSYAEAIRLQPSYTDAWNNRGNALRSIGRSLEALEHYEKAIELNGAHAMARYNSGVTLRLHGRNEEALQRLQQAIALHPNFADGHLYLGHVLRSLNRSGEALTSYGNAIKAHPNAAEYHAHRGDLLRALNRFAEAVSTYGDGLAIDPKAAQLHRGRGLALSALNRPELALSSFDAAIALQPDDPATHANRSMVLKDLGRLGEALSSIEKAIELRPDHPQALGQLLYLKMQMCDWDRLDVARDAVLSGIQRGITTINPFSLLFVNDDVSIQQRCAELYLEDTYPLSSARTPVRNIDIPRSDRIRVAYLSADFHAHATPSLSVGVFEEHDRKHFEVYGVSFGPDDRSQMRARLGSAFEHFLDVRGTSDDQVADLLREKGVDIAVDLNGYTKNARPGIFIRRAAPLQVNFLVFPATLGASHFEYMIADRTVVPESHQTFYTEKLVYLPDSYQCNDSKRPIGAMATTRADCGLPDEGFVFCCFNHNYKITPDIFDVWMRLLGQVEGSVLWLLRSNEVAEMNLHREAERRGIAGNRMIFAPLLPPADHLARLRLADLFLDTLPCGAHTTASDALWSGLPVVTCLGTTFAGRVGASLLHAIGLSDLVMPSLDEYEARALELAHDGNALAEIGSRLARNRVTHPLFDTVRFTRHLEAAYVRMVERQRKGEAPETFAVEPWDSSHG